MIEGILPSPKASENVVHHLCFMEWIVKDSDIECPTPSVAEGNLPNTLSIDVNTFLQSVYPVEKNCLQSLTGNLRQNGSNAKKKLGQTFGVVF
jgi:hypothetical protein